MPAEPVRRDDARALREHPARDASRRRAGRQAHDVHAAAGTGDERAPIAEGDVGRVGDMEAGHGDGGDDPAAAHVEPKHGEAAAGPVAEPVGDQRDERRPAERQAADVARADGDRAHDAERGGREDADREAGAAGRLHDQRDRRPAPGPGDPEGPARQPEGRTLAAQRGRVDPAHEGRLAERAAREREQRGGAGGSGFHAPLTASARLRVRDPL